MAIYHLNLSIGSKGKGKYGGKSALAKFNYITRDDKYINGKKEILATEYGYLPNFAKDNPALFWEATDNYEAVNGVLFRQLEVAFPRELNAEQQQQLCQQFAEAVCGKYHLPYTYAIHKGEFDHRGNKTKEEPTPHFHLIFSERANDETETKKRTAKNYFQRKCGAKKIRELQAKNWLLEHRKLWADLANEALKKAGISERIDHRTLEAQKRELEEKGNFEEAKKLDREPQKKRYWNITKSLDNELDQKELKELSAEALLLEKQIAKTEKELLELEQALIFEEQIAIAETEAKRRTEGEEQIAEALLLEEQIAKEKLQEQIAIAEAEKYLLELQKQAEAEAKRQAEEKILKEIKEEIFNFYRRTNNNSPITSSTERMIKNSIENEIKLTYSANGLRGVEELRQSILTESVIEPTKAEISPIPHTSKPNPRQELVKKKHSNRLVPEPDHNINFSGKGGNDKGGR